MSHVSGLTERSITRAHAKCDRQLGIRYRSVALNCLPDYESPVFLKAKGYTNWRKIIYALPLREYSATIMKAMMIMNYRVRPCLKPRILVFRKFRKTMAHLKEIALPILLLVGHTLRFSNSNERHGKATQTWVYTPQAGTQPNCSKNIRFSAWLHWDNARFLGSVTNATDVPKNIVFVDWGSNKDEGIDVACARLGEESSEHPVGNMTDYISICSDVRIDMGHCIDNLSLMRVINRCRVGKRR